MIAFRKPPIVCLGLLLCLAGIAAGEYRELPVSLQARDVLPESLLSGRGYRINRQKLNTMGVSPAMAAAFLDNYSYDPYEETLLVGELDDMQGVNRRDALIARAERATSRKEAIMIRHLAQMLAGYHANVAPVAALVNLGGVLTLQKKDGGLAVVLPADLLVWTPVLEQKIAAFEKEAGTAGARELLVSGLVDAPVREYLAAKGWKITENAANVLFKAP